MPLRPLLVLGLSLLLFGCSLLGGGPPQSSVGSWQPYQLGAYPPAEEVGPNASWPFPVITAIDIELERNLPTVRATIAGEPVRLLVDLGANETFGLLTESAARVGAERTGDRYRIADAFGNHREAWAVRVDELVLGRGTHAGDTMVGRDVVGVASSAFGAGTFPPDIDGFIGRGLLLASECLVLAFESVEQSRTIAFVTGEEFELGKHVTTLSARLDDEYGVISDMVFVGETRTQRVLWDTGANVNVLNTSALGDRSISSHDPAGNPWVTGLRLAPTDGEPLVTESLVYGPSDFVVLDLRVLPFEVLAGVPMMRERIHFFTRPDARGRMKIGSIPLRRISLEDFGISTPEVERVTESWSESP